MKSFYTALIFMLLFSFASAAQQKKTDRETDGLKGSVKFVSTKRADVTIRSDKMIESNVRLDNQITYKENGERSNYKNYDDLDGLLFEDIDYGFVDGERISIEKDIDNPNKITGIIIGDNKPKKETDPRYDFKFKYKYDDKGNITEESWYQNDGDLWLRYVYTYKGNKREDTVFSADGSLNQKYLYTFDEKGNEIEMFSYNTESDKINGKETYKYLEFDAKGNWTKKITYENEEDDLKRLKPREIQYRTIIYY